MNYRNDSSGNLERFCAEQFNMNLNGFGKIKVLHGLAYFISRMRILNLLTAALIIFIIFRP